MTIAERIEYDTKCLDDYFCRLFAMAKEATLEKFSAVVVSEESEGFVVHNVTTFIRPDMVCNVYSLVDFWLPQLCIFHKRKSNLIAQL